MILQQTACELRDVRNWTNDGSSIPDWVRMQISGEPAPNGTFLVATTVGTARVHPGDIVIEHQGQLWSRSPDEVPQLIEGFGAEAALPIAAIGPGKDAQFGTKSKAGKERRRGGERKIGFRAPFGKPPSIEWLHTTDPPPLKWSALKYGFESLKEDGHGKTPQARRDRREAAAG